MTCIVGLVGRNKEIYMGADSLGTNTNWDGFNRAESKLFIKSGILFGFSGSARMLQIVKHKMIIPERAKGGDVLTFLCLDFIDALRACLKDAGYMEIKDSRENANGTYFLLGIEGRLFTVYSNFQVEEVREPYQAIGSGGDYAKSVIWEYQRFGHLDYPGVIMRALECAAYFNRAVAPPFEVRVLEIRREN